MSDRLGILVKRFESGSKGSLALGSCGNDWGLSCGTFQLTLRWGNCIWFLKKFYPTEAASLYFNNKGDFATPNYPGSDYCSSPEEVKSVWTKCYNQNPNKFEDNEYAHIKASYYDQLIKKLGSLYYPRSRAMQECLWSWAVHKGSSGALSGFKSALTKLGVSKGTDVSEDKLFDAVYDIRYSVNPTNRYSKNSTSERETLRPYLNSPLFGEKASSSKPSNNQKGDNSMDIITAYATKNPCYKKGTPMTPRGIVVHSTGANNPNLRRYVDCEAECGKNSYGNHWNNANVDVCVHAFIGYDKNNNVRVANILPYNYACWGVGGGSKGSFNYDPVGHIQFEMCEDGLTNKDYCMKVYNKAVEYCAYLCKKFGFDPLGKNVIVSHAEAHKLGYGSNHGDPHNWWNRFGLTMDGFRAAVKAKMNEDGSTTPSTPTNPTTPSTEMYRIRKTWADSKSQVGAYKNLENAKKACPVGYTVFNSKGEAVYTNNATTPTTPSTATAYKVVTNLTGYNNAADAKYRKNGKTTLKPGTYYIYKKYPNGYNGMYNITTDSTGATPGCWINPNDNKVAAQTPYSPKIGDKVIVSGGIAEYGNGKGNVVNVTNKTMYVKDLVSSKVYSHYIGVSLTKTSARYGWVKLSSIKKA